MFNLFKSSLYKLFKEKTFLITLIIGTGLGILIPVIMHLVIIGLAEGEIPVGFGGEVSILNSTSVGSNFGLTVPINLAVVTIAEFTTGTLRNKVIAGYRKSSIYISLLFSGLVFTILLLGYYIALNVLVGTILDGFDASRLGGVEFVLPYFAITLCSYIFVTSLSIFVSTSLRNIGASIPIIVILLVILSMFPTFTAFSDNKDVLTTVRWLNPVQVLSQYASFSTLFGIDMTEFKECIAPGIASPLIYSAIFIGFGIFEFAKRDIK